MFISACNKERTEKMLEILQHNRVNIPYDRLVRIAPVDTMKNVASYDYRLIVYIDSTECTSCVVKNMFYWESLLDSVKTKNIKPNFDIVFIFSPPKADNERIIYQMKLNEHLIDKIFIDTCNVFITENPHIPQEQMYHTFLLNKNDSVIMVGNPKNYPKIERLLFKKLEEK